MELKLEVYGCLCELSTFEINSIEADYDDFGDKYDHDSEKAEDYCCGDMQFDGKDSTPEILAKYSINQTEYDDIVSQLTEKLSFGGCGWCS